MHIRYLKPLKPFKTIRPELPILRLTYAFGRVMQEKLLLLSQGEEKFYRERGIKNIH